MNDYSDEAALVAERALDNLGGVQSVDVDRTA